MDAHGPYSFVGAWAVAFIAVAVLALILRWAFSRGGSLIAPPPRPGTPDDYGLLVPISEAGPPAAAERVRQILQADGIRVTIARTNAGPFVMVFPADVARARAVLEDHGQSSA